MNRPQRYEQYNPDARFAVNQGRQLDRPKHHHIDEGEDDCRRAQHIEATLRRLREKREKH